MSRTDQPLAIYAVQNDGTSDVRVARRGADFTEPSLWREMGFGDLCWTFSPTAATTELTLPGPLVPFRTVPNVWAYSAVIVMTNGGPIVYKKPKQGQTVSGQGLEITGGVVCVKAVISGQGLRADPTDSAAPGTATPATAPAPAPATASAAPATIAPRPSATTSATPGTIAPQPSPSPTKASATPTSAAPAPAAGNADQGSDKKITICHATSSQSTPYNAITISTNAVASSGHQQHSGPLYPQYGWGDVIPAFDDYPGMNWPAGASLVDAGCAVPTDPTPTPTPTPSGTAVAPLATVSPTPTPSGTAVNPLATVSPTPTTNATLPPVEWPVVPIRPDFRPAPIKPPLIELPTDRADPRSPDAQRHRRRTAGHRQPHPRDGTLCQPPAAPPSHPWPPSAPPARRQPPPAAGPRPRQVHAGPIGVRQHRQPGRRRPPPARPTSEHCAPAHARRRRRASQQGPDLRHERGQHGRADQVLPEIGVPGPRTQPAWRRLRRPGLRHGDR